MPRKSTKNITTEASVNTTETNVVISKDEVTTQPLNDNDEIEVVSLVPNVSYKDVRTNDMYEWDRVGHIEYLTVESLKILWRNHKGYFRNLWLKPNDDRVIKLFGLNNVYDKYAFLMDSSNYTRNKIDDVCKTILDCPNSLKFAICDKVKTLIMDGAMSDVFVIRKIEKCFDVDLLSLLE